MTLTCRQMRDLEEAAFARGVSAASLMETAGAEMAAVCRQFHPEPRNAVLYLGKGNNAGDALVVARHLLAQGWHVFARLAFAEEEFGPLPAELWGQLKEQIRVLGGPDPVVALRGSVILLDGVVGLGAAGPLRGGPAELVREMNALRQSRHCIVIALDLPSGLSPLNGEPLEPCVMADLTITVAQMKSALLVDAATPFAGRLAVARVPELEAEAGDAGSVALVPELLVSRLPSRSFDTHKGQMGRVSIIAGSKGCLGAAELCATAALRAGAGLVSLYVKEEIYPIIAARMPAEIMVRTVKDYREVLRDAADALAIGPGLGLLAEDEILATIARAEVPAVLDADALNMLARRGFDSLAKSKAPRLLTPHPGEMARMIERMPECQGLQRARLVQAFLQAQPRVTLLLKGSRTIIGEHGQPLAYNTTGHHGMATGGMGDVLTGIAAALMAGGVSAYDAGCLGSWLSGRAAELALEQGDVSAESLSADTVLSHLGGAFMALRSVCY